MESSDHKGVLAGLLRERFRVIIGGTGTSAEYARLVDANGWGKDGGEAAGLCRQLLASTGTNLKSEGCD